MTTSITTLESIAAAASMVILVACGAAPQSGVSTVGAGEPPDRQTTPSADDADDLVPWSRLPDGDRTGRTHANSTGCDTFDTLLPC